MSLKSWYKSHIRYKTSRISTINSSKADYDVFEYIQIIMRNWNSKFASSHFEIMHLIFIYIFFLCKHLTQRLTPNFYPSKYSLFYFWPLLLKFKSSRWTIYDFFNVISNDLAKVISVIIAQETMTLRGVWIKYIEG